MKTYSQLLESLYPTEYPDWVEVGPHPHADGIAFVRFSGVLAQNRALFSLNDAERRVIGQKAVLRIYHNDVKGSHVGIVKIDFSRRKLYFLSKESQSGDTDDIIFDKQGYKIDRLIIRDESEFRKHF